MKDRITAIKVNLTMLLRRIEKMNFSEQVNYELEQKLNETQLQIYKIGDLLEEIEAMIND